MCEVISIMATVLGSMALATGVTGAVQRSSQQNSLNAAIEDAYNQELELARSRFNLQEQQNAEETQSKNLQNAQERRRDNLEAMQSNASSEAAMSALGIAGATAGRETAVRDVQTIQREGAYDARGDLIQTQHLMNSLGFQKEYENAVTSAYNRGMSAWQPIQNDWWVDALNIGMDTAQGAASGAQLGMGMKQAGLFETKENPFIFKDPVMPSTTKEVFGEKFTWDPGDLGF